MILMPLSIFISIIAFIITSISIYQIIKNKDNPEFFRTWKVETESDFYSWVKFFIFMCIPFLNLLPVFAIILFYIVFSIGKMLNLHNK